MIAGHFGLAAAVKARARHTPLWAMMLASQWLDVVFVPLLVVGVERLGPAPGTKPGAYGGAVIHADYTHSLVGALLLSALFGALFVRRYGSRSGSRSDSWRSLTGFSIFPSTAPTCRSCRGVSAGGPCSVSGCGSTPRSRPLWSS
jgi:hypothetical protein